MLFLHTVSRKLPRPIVLLSAAGALVMLGATASGAERHNFAAADSQVIQATPVANVVGLTPISTPIGYSLKAGYTVVCDTIVRAQVRNAPSWTMLRTTRYSTEPDGGSTVLTYDVLKHSVIGSNKRLRVDDAGSGFKIVLNESGEISQKDVWVNPNFRWGLMQRDQRIAGLNRQINWVVGVKKKLGQGDRFWYEEVAKQMAAELLMEFDSRARLTKYSDGTRVQGIGTLEGAKVIVVEGLIQQSGFGRGISFAINDQIRSLRYLESGLPAGEFGSRRINTNAQVLESTTTCEQSQGS